MAEPCNVDKRKAGVSEFMRRRAKSTRCRKCNRLNAFFKKVDNLDFTIRMCRYCKFTSLFDKLTGTYTEE